MEVAARQVSAHALAVLARPFADEEAKTVRLHSAGPSDVQIDDEPEVSERHREQKTERERRCGTEDARHRFPS